MFTYSQEKKIQQVTTSIQASYGFVLPHHSAIYFVVNDNISGVDILLGKGYLPNILDSERKPLEIGMGLTYVTLGNKDIYGGLIAVYPYIKKEILQGKKSSLHSIFSVGIGLTTKPFNVHSNYKNIAYSSYLNGFFSTGLTYAYQFNSKLAFLSSLHLRHISNGAVKRPNKGINMLSSGMGFQYQLKGIDVTDFKPKQTNTHHKKKSFLVLGNVGYHQVSYIDANKYFKASFTAEYIRPVRHKWFWGAGIDYFYDTGIDRYDFGKPNKKFYFRSSVGVHGSIGAMLEKVDIYGAIGKTLYYKYHEDKKPFSRVGIRYHFSENMLANLSLKAFFFRADFVEIGLGYLIF